MPKTLANLLPDFLDAWQVARELEAAGFSRKEISIVANDATREFADQEGTAPLDLPGIGPVVAAGPVVPALLRAGELSDALAETGLSKEDAHFLSEGVELGGAVVIVHAPDDQAEEAEAILEQCDLETFTETE